MAIEKDLLASAMTYYADNVYSKLKLIAANIPITLNSSSVKPANLLEFGYNNYITVISVLVSVGFCS